MLKTNNQESFTQFRKEYPLFIYNNYNYILSGNKLSFSFEFKLNDEFVFKPSSTIILPEIPKHGEKIDTLIENLVFHIGMIELVSYWKATCSPVIQVNAGSLSEEQVNWWKELYYNGLGEFFYLNSIKTSQDEFVSIQSQGKHYSASEPGIFSDEYIVPVGGGKDSAVTLNLLQKSGYKVHPLIMNPRGATIDTVRAANISIDRIITIKRTIDPVLLQLNDQGFLNGHTPFSAMLAFYTLLASSLTGYMNIALSNESSANEATIPGSNINHQYSKSVYFESNFRNYYHKYISRSINYFSFLRPLNELQIASIFSGLTQYHHIFKSCNVGSKTNTWCGSCPKCLFTHIMLSAFKGIEYTNEIIGKPMLDDLENEQYFDELCGFSAIKPFECVGTLNDVLTAMQMIVDHTPPEKLPILAKRYISLQSTKKPIDETSINVQHFLSSELLSILKQAVK